MLRTIVVGVEGVDCFYGLLIKDHIEDFCCHLEGLLRHRNLFMADVRSYIIGILRVAPHSYQ